MRLSEYERKVLLASPIYQYYQSTAFSTLTPSIVRAHIEAIPKVGIENLPILKFLGEVLKITIMTEVFQATANPDTFHNMYTKVSALYDEISAFHEESQYDLGRSGYGQTYDALTRIDTIDITLSSGAISNQEVVAAVSSKYGQIVWATLNGDTNPGTSYVLTFHEATGGVNAILTWLAGDDLGSKKYLWYDGTGTNEAIQVDVSGGAGAEKLKLAICWNTHS